MREFVGIDLGHEPVPGETTILHIRDLLERHGLGKNLFERQCCYAARARGAGFQTLA